jgi:Exodeoxyribonuclease V, gamma subunit/RecC C-terminal domain
MSGLGLFLSEDLDALVDRYVEDLEPSANPLERRTVVVPTSALGQWFEQAVARRTGPGGRDDGVVANVDLIFPSGLIGRALYGDAGAGERWSATALALALMDDEESSRLSWSDARTRARALEQLVVHRGDRLDELLDHEGLDRERRLVAQRRSAGHLTPAEAFARDGVGRAVLVGSHVTIVGCVTSTSGGLLCDVARALAERSRVDVFLPVVSRTVAVDEWARDPADRSLAERWGAVTRAHLDRWRTRARPAAETWVSARRATSSAVVDALSGGDAGDASGAYLEVHRAVGVARQVEVARDAILRAVAATGVAAHQVRVVTPDAARVAPLLATYFHADDPMDATAPRVQFELADPRMSRPSPRLDAMRELLRIVDSDVTVQDVAALLGQPAVRAGVGLSHLDAERIIDLAREGRVSLGLDAPSRAHLEVFEASDDTGTWTRFVDRVVMAHVFDAERDGVADDIATLGVAEDVAVIARFHRLVSWLRAAVVDAAHPMDLAAWTHTLGRWSEVVARDDRVRDPGLDRLLADLAGLAAESRAPLGLADVRELVDELSRRAGGSTLLGRGGVTVVDLVGSASLPFEVTCVIGLDDEALPDSTRPLGELGDARDTDPDPRAEFRAALLGLVASTRQRMIVVTNDRSVVDGAVLASTQPLSELVEALSPRGLVVSVRHARHGFSVAGPRGGDDGDVPAPATLDPVHGEVAAVLASRDDAHADAEIALVRLRPVERPSETIVDANDLVEYLSAPQRVFLRDALGAAALHAGRAEELPDVPFLDLGGTLASWAIGERLLLDAVATGNPPAVPVGPDSAVASVAAGYRARVTARVDVEEIARFAGDVRDSLEAADAVRDPRGERPSSVRGRHHEISRSPMDLYQTSVGPVLFRYTTSTTYSSRVVALVIDLAVLTAETGEAVTGVLLRGRTRDELAKGAAARPFLTASWAPRDPVGDAQRLLGGVLRIYARRFDGVPLHFSATSLAYGARQLDHGLAVAFRDPSSEWLTRQFGGGDDYGESLRPENQLLVPLDFEELLEVFDGGVARASLDLVGVLGAVGVRVHDGATPWHGVLAARRDA